MDKNGYTKYVVIFTRLHSSFHVISGALCRVLSHPIILMQQRMTSKAVLLV